ncbi:hypothetical protein C3Y91_31215 [Rhizobium sp. UPM1133]|nr:hypothetical protein [Rhizobium ruizarguesonis]
MRSTRRDFLKQLTAVGLGSMLPISMSTKAHAFPWAAVALAVGSYVAGMIASHNRRNVEAYMLAAIRQELRVATLQLASLQLAVAAVLDELAKLPAIFEEGLAKRSLLDAQARVKAEIGLYFEQISTRDKYDSDELWFAASNRRERLNDILQELQRNRQILLQTESSLEPSTAIVMASAALVEISLMNLSNLAAPVYDSTTINAIISAYDEYFAAVKSLSPGSTQLYLDTHQARRQTTFDKLKLNPLWTDLQASGKLTNCAQFHTFRPPQDKPGSPMCGQFPKFCRTIRFDFHRLYDVLELETTRAHELPEVKTELEKLKIDPSEAGSDLNFTVFSIAKSVYQYRVKKDDPWTRPDLDNPEEPQADAPRQDCEQQNLNIVANKVSALTSITRADERKYKELLKESKIFRKLGEHYQPVANFIDELNLESAKVEYARQALSAVDATIQSLDQVRGSFK